MLQIPARTPTQFAPHPAKATQAELPERLLMLPAAQRQILSNQGATLADCQALKLSLNEVLNVNYLLLLCPRPKDNAHPRASMGFFG